MIEVNEPHLNQWSACSKAKVKAMEANKIQPAAARVLDNKRPSNTVLHSR